MGIYAWGTGCGASELVSNGLAAEKITAFIDNFPFGKSFLGRPVLLPDELNVSDCTLMIITARDSETIRKRCLDLGISEDKLFYLKNSWQLTDRNLSCDAARLLLGDTLYENLHQKQVAVTIPPILKERLLPAEDQNNDYVRLSTLELLCRRLKNVAGNVAELGVYKGNFARCLNLLLPERKLYLFDSFEGFETAEAQKETAQQTCTDAFVEAHKNTSITQVLKRLPYPENVFICQGFFPESAQNIFDTFCLVSLDVDFEDATYEGLKFFWPKLAEGGYLLLHDWNSPNLSGVAAALARFEKELGHSIPSVPLCDTGGTLILCK